MGLLDGTFDASDAIKTIESYYDKASAWVVKKVKEVIKDLIKIVGDYPRLHSLIQTWIDAAGPISKGQSYIQSAQTDLSSAWTGGASASYKTYLDNLNQAGTDLSNCIWSKDGSGIGNHLQGVGTAIMNNYNALLALTNDCASAILKAESGLAGHISKLVSGIVSKGKDLSSLIDGASGIVSDIDNAMIDFANAFTKWVNTTVNNADTMIKEIEAISADAEKLVVPSSNGY